MGMEKLNKYSSLKLTDNGKVRWRKKHLNTMSLKSGPVSCGGSCAGATKGEQGCIKKCYDRTLTKLYRNYRAVEEYNFDLLKQAKTVEQLAGVLQNTVNKWLLTVGLEDPYFRIHTGGDFYNYHYAEAWRQVIDNTPEVRFWAYTRTLNVVPILADCKNLTLYLSCDPVNKAKVYKMYMKYRHKPNIAVAWMGNELPEDFPQDRKTLICPEVTGKMRNLDQQGACSRCRACIDRPLKSGEIRHVRFPIHR